METSLTFPMRMPFHFLNEDIKHLRLYKELHKMAVGFGLCGLAEALRIEEARLATTASTLHMACKVSNRCNEERQESLRDNLVQLLSS